MKIRINDVNVNYVRYGNENGPEVILLHGWKQNIEMMQGIGSGLAANCHITIVDLPGHGQSTTPTYPWTIGDYADCIHELVTNLKIKDPILVGHSFGGKISLLYATKYPVKKLVVLSSPYKARKEKLSLKVKVMKSLKDIIKNEKLINFAKKHTGSTDYRNADPMMREIMVQHVNLDIKDELFKIKCPTVIIWGTLDKAVPINDAYELEQLLDNAGLVVYENCTHYAYLERLGQTIRVLKSFIEG
jgi:pimeloyl-ACP methyl ester carboxylesterase